jgi:hypothetical protein
MATVGPAGPKALRGGRRRTLLLTTIVGIGALAIGTVVVNRAAGTSRATGTETAGSVPAAFRFPATTKPPRTPTTVKRRPVPTSSSTSATPPATAGVRVLLSPPASGPDPTAPVDTVPPTTTTLTPTTVLAPAVTATLPPPPPPYGPSALTWTAPKSMTIGAGMTAPLSVRAYNPTGRSVSLSHRLTCTPRLDHGEVCADMVQLIGSHQSASADYTIDAAGFGPGSYTLTIEGVLTIDVTVS